MGSDHDDIPGLKAHDKGFDDAMKEKRNPKSLCSVCGQPATVYPPDGDDSPTYCEAHCPDHDYRYERGEGWRCFTCFAEPPHDFFSEEIMRLRDDG